MNRLKLFNFILFSVVYLLFIFNSSHDALDQNQSINLLAPKSRPKAALLSMKPTKPDLIRSKIIYKKSVLAENFADIISDKDRKKNWKKTKTEYSLHNFPGMQYFVPKTDKALENFLNQLDYMERLTLLRYMHNLTRMALSELTQLKVFASGIFYYENHPAEVPSVKFKSILAKALKYNEPTLPEGMTIQTKFKFEKKLYLAKEIKTGQQWLEILGKPKQHRRLPLRNFTAKKKYKRIDFSI